MSEVDRWSTTLHLAYLDGKLCVAAICNGTVSEVARRTMQRHLPDARRVSRTYPLGESDWPVELIYEGTRQEYDDSPEHHWRHEFRRPDEPWPMDDAPTPTPRPARATTPQEGHQ